MTEKQNEDSSTRWRGSISKKGFFCFVPFFYPSVIIIIFTSEKHSKSLDEATDNATVDNTQCLGAEMP